MPAIALVAALPELAVAIAAVLLAWAAGTLLAKPLAWALQQIPVVGGQAAGYVTNALSSVAGYALGWAETEVGALSQLISAPIAGLQRFATSTVSAIESAVGQLAALGATVAGGLGAFGAMVAGMVGQLAAAVASIALLQAGAAVVADALAAIRNVIIPAAVATGVAEAVAVADKGIEALGRTVSADVAGVQADLATAVATGETALRQAERDILGQLGTATGVLEGEIGAVGALVAPLVAANLISRVATIAQTLTTTLDECVTPTCNVMKPQLGLLNALMDGGLLLLVGALVGDAVNDPRGAAADVAGVVGTVEDGARGLLSAFAGISV